MNAALRTPLSFSSPALSTRARRIWISGLIQCGFNECRGVTERRVLRVARGTLTENFSRARIISLFTSLTPVGRPSNIVGKSTSSNIRYSTYARVDDADTVPDAAEIQIFGQFQVGRERRRKFANDVSGGQALLIPEGFIPAT